MHLKLVPKRRQFDDRDEETGLLHAPPQRVTPLSMLSMAVLCVTVLSEFLCANVSSPWILFMVHGFHEFPDEAANGYWTGILVSMFFLTQFLTSIIWAKLAAAYGQRTVILVSLLGSAITCLLFGVSTSMRGAMLVRLLQGVFGGAVGVARSCVPLVTDKTNEKRAYTVVGFAWGLGGVVGAIVGGAFESPTTRWPFVFGQSPILAKFPYLLACAVAASVPFAGSVMCLFLGPDCRPRQHIPASPAEKPAAMEQTSSETPLLHDAGLYALYGSLRGSIRRPRRGRRSARTTRFGYDPLGRASSVVSHREDTEAMSTTSSPKMTPSWKLFDIDIDDEESEAEDEGHGTRFYRTRSLPVQAAPLPHALSARPVSRARNIRRPLRSVSRSRTIKILDAQPASTDVDVPCCAMASPYIGVLTLSDTPETQFLLTGLDVSTQTMPSITEAQVFVPSNDVCPKATEPSENSLIARLPFLVIVQYGLLALYTATHDQVFYLYFVSEYPSGGLGLDASSFSQLIALMCIAQTVYQFVCYPALQSRFSSLYILRIGTALFIPAYLTMIIYRYMVASPMLPCALILSTAIRFCGATFAFTAVSVLLNTMSEPHVVGYANAVAQSFVSLARFVGPIIGGLLWSTGVQDGPSGFYLGFVVCAGICSLTLVHSLLIGQV